MRILSQDGMIDVPYEQVIIQQFKEKIYFLNKNLTGVENLVDDMELATYSTESKTQKSMEMLHEEYQFEKQFETICCGTTDYPSKPLYYFQFPSDEELGD